MQIPHLFSLRSLAEWNLTIRTSVASGQFRESLHLYSSMLMSGIRGDNFTFPCVSKACGKLGAFRDGMKVHAISLIMGYEDDVFVQTSLMDMYGKCSALSDARRLFDEMPVRSLVSWNSMISAYVKEGQISASFALLGRMRGFGMKPNAGTLVGLLSSCNSPGWIGPSLHCHGIKLGVDGEIRFSNSLIGMYMRCGLLDAALSFFELMKEKSAISWTAVVGGYIKSGDNNNALRVFNQMRQCDVDLDAVSLLNLICSCCLPENSLLVGSAHALTIRIGFEDKNLIQNSLLISYAKSQDLVSAEKVFGLIHEKDAFSWTSMIAGYVQNGCASRALSLSENMLKSGIELTEVTATTILSACAEFGSPDVGQKVEAYLTSKKVQLNHRVQTSLIHMYCKCGNLERAREIFHMVDNKDVAVWSCMISGYAIHGMGMEALALYEEMKCQGMIEPDAVAFTSILSACCHSGLVEEGLKLFKSMRDDFQINHGREHCLCLVDMLCRGNHIDTALEVIRVMPGEVQAQMLSSFLSAYRGQDVVQLKDFDLKKLLHMQQQSCGNYILMSQSYASVGKWQDAMEIRKQIDYEDLVKKPGCSRMELSC